MLTWEGRLSFGGRGGLCLEELTDRAVSFSIGGGGVADSGESTAAPSGKRGSSGTTICANVVEFNIFELK